MAGMKITLDAAMRTRDISQPSPAQEAAAERAEAAQARSARTTARPPRKPQVLSALQPAPAATAARADKVIGPDDAGPDTPRRQARVREPLRSGRRRMRRRPRNSQDRRAGEDGSLSRSDQGSAGS